MVNLQKDYAQISVNLQGKTYTGTVTDADLLCFYGLFFMEEDERKTLQRKGHSNLLEVVQERQKRLLEELETIITAEIVTSGAKLTPEQIKAKASDELPKRFDRQVAESLFFKVNNNHQIRAEVAVRTIEIFPNIDRSLVSYNNAENIGGFRLAARDMMTLLMSILAGLMGLDYDEPEAEPETAAEVPLAIKILPPEAKSEEIPFGFSEDVWAALPEDAKNSLREKAGKEAVRV